MGAWHAPALASFRTAVTLSIHRHALLGASPRSLCDGNERPSRPAVTRQLSYMARPPLREQGTKTCSAFQPLGLGAIVFKMKVLSPLRTDKVRVCALTHMHMCAQVCNYWPLLLLEAMCFAARSAQPAPQQSHVCYAMHAKASVKHLNLN